MEKSANELQVGDVIDVQGLLAYTSGVTKEIKGLGVVTGIYHCDARKDSFMIPSVMAESCAMKALPLNWMPQSTKVRVADEKEAATFREKWNENFLTAKRGTLVSGRGTTGCDPEFFVVDEKEEVIPAWTFLPEKQAGDTVYWDGFQAEFVVPDGRGCLEELNAQIKYNLEQVLCRARVKNPKAEISMQNVVTLPMATLMGADKKHVELGCSPSLNVYGDRGKEVEDPVRLEQRFAGGHQHFGISFDARRKEKQVETLIRALDAVVGVAGVSLAAQWDNPLRRVYYGRAGEYRLPHYGIEYRVLSNFWLIHPAIAMLVNELFRVVIRWAMSGYSPMWNAEEKEVRSIINNCDVEAARALLVKNSKVLEALCWNTNFCGGGPSKASVDGAVYTFINGIESLKMPHSVEKNWSLMKGSDTWTSSRRTWGLYASGHREVFAPGV